MSLSSTTAGAPPAARSPRRDQLDAARLAKLRERRKGDRSGGRGEEPRVAAPPNGLRGVRACRPDRPRTCGGRNVVNRQPGAFGGLIGRRQDRQVGISGWKFAPMLRTGGLWNHTGRRIKSCSLRVEHRQSAPFPRHRGSPTGGRDWRARSIECMTVQLGRSHPSGLGSLLCGDIAIPTQEPCHSVAGAEDQPPRRRSAGVNALFVSTLW